MLNGLSLFTGIGGLDVALSDWVRPVIGCEIETYCQSVLFSRMADESLSNFPIWDDIRTLSGMPFNGSIDIIYGGFPCQGISVAGLGKGLEDERSGLFFEIVRLAKEIKPAFIFLENVPAIASRGGLQVVREVTQMGYDCRWCIISAASVGASHKRERWFLLAHSNNNGSSTSARRGVVRECVISGKGQKEQKESFGQIERASCLSANVADSESQRSQEGRQPLRTEETKPRYYGNGQHDSWRKEPENKLELVGVANGISRRVDRIKSLGNAVVSLQAKEAFKILMGLK